jgi:predicted CXXCH cytochrome family protein
VSQSDAFCFGCHKLTGPVSQVLPYQYNYSRIAGGDNNTSPNNIYDAFQLTGSTHGLAAIQTVLTNKGSTWKFNSTAANNNPCSGCHNPHLAKRDPHGSGTPIRTDANGNLITSSVSRPSLHNNRDSKAWSIWGDGTGERMKDYAVSVVATYCAPYRFGSTTTREPDGCSATSPTDCTSACANGSGLFDTVNFCQDCHVQSVGGRQAINWTATGDIHGVASQVCCNYGDKKAPYPADPSPPTPYPNYVLSCLDCHEPHGSPNEFLLRQEVNGTNNGLVFGTNKQWWNFCSACHTINTGGVYYYHFSVTSSSNTCWTCHTHNKFLGGCDLAGGQCGGHVKTF